MKKKLAGFFKAVTPELWLAIAAILLLGGWLGGHGIWTQEYRWQQVCLRMLQTGDYWHPYLDGKPYYDKPLLSYWLIIALAKLNHGDISNTLLRLPALLAGLISLGCCYSIVKRFFDRQSALLAGWLLLTTFYFVFWARVASADILNIASIMVALWWFLKLSLQPTFCQLLMLFVILAIGALLKGLIAPVLVFLIVLPMLWQQQRWRIFLTPCSLLAMLLGAILYFAPFIVSNLTDHAHYQENGLVEVFRENILRFFVPFDHAGSWYIYVFYLPLYTLPWLPLWILALIKLIKNFSASTQGERWLSWSLLVIFIFLSLSGSRRSYYILPAVPFAIMLAAVYSSKLIMNKSYLKRVFQYTIAFFYLGLVTYFVVIQPLYYLHHQ